MLSVIHFKDFETEAAIIVPTEILAKDINGWYLFVVNENNIVEKRYVKIGISDKNNTLIKEGIKENEKIIVNGFNLVKDGMKVEIANSEN